MFQHAPPRDVGLIIQRLAEAHSLPLSAYRAALIAYWQRQLISTCNHDWVFTSPDLEDCRCQKCNQPASLVLMTEEHAA